MRRLCWFSWPFGLAVALSVWVLPGWFGLGLGLCALLAGLLLPVAFPHPARYLRCICFGLSLGLFWCFGWNSLVSFPAEGEAQYAGTFSGMVTGYASQTDYGCRLPVELEIEGASVPTLLYLSDPEPDLRPGDTITCVARLSPAGLDLRMKDYQFSGGGEYIALTGHEDSLRHLPAQLSHWLKEAISSLFTGDGLGLMTALLTGDQSGLSNAAVAALRTTGLSHIVAVSGLHMSLLAAGCLKLFPGRQSRFLVIPLLVLFALMVNTPSCWRALLMFLLALSAPIFGREEDGLTSLAFAFVLILLSNPYTINSLSFQLSFLAVLGILVVSNPLSTALRRAMARRRLRLPVKGAILTVGETLFLSLGANFFLLPLLAWHFGQVSLISPLSNLLVSWMLPFLFLGGLVTALTAPLLPPLAAAAAGFLQFLAEGLLAAAGGLARLPYAAVNLTGFYGVVWMACLYLTALLLFRSKYLRRRWYLPAGGILLVLGVALASQTLSLTRSGLTVQALDVGQGQSILLRSEGKTAALDCGGDSDPGALLAQALLSTGEDTLNVLVLSHFDSDHVNGMETLFAQVTVENVYIPAVEDESGWLDTLLALAAETGTVVNYVTEPTGLALGSTTVTLYPSSDTSDDNSSSLTTLVTRDGFTMLSTGDLDELGELALLSRYDLPQIDLLVAGHHGSKSSTSQLLLEDIRPETAVISVGENPYGHPSVETLARLQGNDIAIYRTDQNGTITIRVEDQEDPHGGNDEKNN